MFFRKKPSADMWLVVGLGNPEPRYDGTRHNAGFAAVDTLCDSYGINLNRNKHKAVYGEGVIGNVRVLVIKPQTYMNLSGEAVGALARFYKVPNERVLVLSDDISLDVGKIRIRRNGSAGGHNGLKNIIAHLGGEDFPRIKIGVGKKPNDAYDLVDWVLGKIPAEQANDYDTALKNSAKAVELIVSGQTENAMNRYSR